MRTNTPVCRVCVKVNLSNGIKMNTSAFNILNRIGLAELACGRNTHTATLSFNLRDSIRRFESLMKSSGAAAAVQSEQVPL